MRLLTAAEMRAVDARVIEEIGISSMILMENAGRQVAEVAATFLQAAQGQKVSIIAGKGNNGGDGLVAARYLHNLGYKVRVFLLARATELTGDGLANYEICKQLGIDLQEVDEKYLPKLRFCLSLTDLIIDALLGTGLKGAPQGLMAQTIELINDVEKTVLAVDVPSGLDASNGAASGACIRADLTVTLAAPKVGLFTYPGADRVGQVYVANIGIPPQVLESAGSGALLKATLVKERLPIRPSDGHKGTFGHVLILAGSVGMTGAATLTAEAALRSGAGLVSLGIPASLNDIMEVKLTEAMTIPLPETADRKLSIEASPVIHDHLRRMDALVVGPGLGSNPSTGQLVEALLQEVSCPVVLDADGLNLAAKLDILQARNDASCPLIVTPHPGEMARLLRCSIKEVQADRVAAAQMAAQRFYCTVVLKGAGTVVAAPNGDFWVNTTGNVGMATGGTGDVLSGIIGALLAGGVSPVLAAGMAVYVHGLAGDFALKRRGEISLIAGDLIEAMPAVWQAIQQEEVKEPWIYLV
ncbi:MAG: NAD(P)H-hydrate dehydratase [Firmicutes bacterium]|nr:NAD(P)H-hydrate dehydratase [Bacillota bacterium]